jgi:Cu-Zn family superoxide dismutase
MKFGIYAASIALVATFGCSTTAWNDAGRAKTAKAEIEARSGSSVTGVVEFQQAVNDKVYVRVALKGLPPNTRHGIHLHENGDCSAADASSAGAHFNPTGAPHAGPSAEMHHAGDLGNVLSDANGEVNDHFAAQWLELESGQTAVVGHSVVVHAEMDDLTSQPSGNSGARIGCGVVAMATSMQ